MKVTQLPSAIACGIVICAFATSTALAESSPALPDNSGADVGTGWNILSIPAAAFVPQNSSWSYHTDANGYVYPSGAPIVYFHAPVNLPGGASIGFLNLYAYDPQPGSLGGDVTAYLRRLTGYGSVCSQTLCTFPPVPPASEQIAAAHTTGGNGHTYESAIVSPPHTVSNSLAQYVVVVSFTGAALGFKGVDLWWKRQISPAPVMASFTDVPPGAQFFAEIEAMKAAGITGGCTATTFCPDSTVTRRQMAAFFARALGLYWPY
jgi:S-layer homology domain